MSFIKEIYNYVTKNIKLGEMKMYTGKVIDFHVHVGNFSMLRNDIQDLLMLKNASRDFDVQKVFSEPAHLIPYLEAAGIEIAVLLGEDGPGTNYHITSQFVCEFRNRTPDEHKDMFVCLGSLNPNKITSTPLEKYHFDIESGVLGYKLYPSEHNFDPLSDALLEVYSEMEKNRHILMFHTGESAQVDSVDKWQSPADFKMIPEKFPNLTVVLAHGGKKKYADEAFDMLIKYPNVYMDTGFITTSMLSEMYPDISKVVDKILFASDLPGGVSSLIKYIQNFREMSLSEDEVSKILY